MSGTGSSGKGSLSSLWQRSTDILSPKKFKFMPNNAANTGNGIYFKFLPVLSPISLTPSLLFQLLFLITMRAWLILYITPQFRHFPLSLRYRSRCILSYILSAQQYLQTRKMARLQLANRGMIGKDGADAATDALSAKQHRRAQVRKAQMYVAQSG